MYKRQVRAYQKRSVERAVLEQVLEAGRIAPTACNRQPVHLLVAHTPAVSYTHLDVYKRQIRP